jgi:CHASE3 domain sensor protein
VVGTPIGSRDQQGLLRSAVVFSGGTIVVVGVVLAVLALTLAGQRDSNRRVRRSELVLRTASEAERSVVDIETALRGYVITRDPTFLRPYREGVPDATRSSDRLVALTADEPAQQERARQIRGRIAEYVDGYARPLIELVKTAPEHARSEETTDQGRGRVDALRRGFADLTAAERDRLTARTRSSDRSAQRAIVVGIGGLLVLLAIVVAFGAYVARRIARPVRDMSIAAERMAAGDLTVRVPEAGAGELGARLRDVVAERRTVTDAELEGTTLLSPDVPRTWRASYFPIVLEAGETVGSGAIFVDITDHRRAARERQRLLAAERLAAQHTARLQEITGHLSRAAGARDVAQVVVEQGVEALRAQAGVVVLLAAGTSELQLAAMDGYDERDALDFRELRVSSSGPLPEALRTGRPVAIVGRRELRERFPERAEAMGRPGHRSWVAAPISVAGEVRGGALFAFGTTRRLPDEDRRLLELLLAQAGPALDRAALYERQRHIASTLQRSLLPAHMPEIPGIELAAVYRPAGDGNEVGGDFYDVVPAPGGRWIVAIGDVQGKGPEAAALTGLVRHTLRAETLREGDPAHLLRMLNRVVYHDDTDRFCTVALAAIEPGAAGVRVRVACGGHLPPIVTRRDAAPAEVACRGTLLGVEEDIRAVVEEVGLGIGDGLVLYTDGVLDAGAPDTTLTADHLVRLLAGAGPGSPYDLAWMLHDAAVGDAPAPRDDIAIIALRVGSAEPVPGAAPASSPAGRGLGGGLDRT